MDYQHHFHQHYQQTPHSSISNDCQRCGHTIGDFEVHNSKHVLFNDPGTAFKCTLCELGFLTRRGWSQHCLTIHDIQSIPQHINNISCDQWPELFSNEPGWFQQDYGNFGTGNGTNYLPKSHLTSYASDNNYSNNPSSTGSASSSFPSTNNNSTNNNTSTSRGISTTSTQSAGAGTRGGAGTGRTKNSKQQATQPTEQTEQSKSSQQTPAVKKIPLKPGEVRCPRCFTGHAKKQLTKHLMLHDNFDKTGINYQPDRCESCQISYMSSTSIIRHYREKICESGINYIEPAMDCTRCGLSPDLAGGRSSHNRLHSNFDEIDSDGEPHYTARCNDCMLAWSSVESLNGHFESSICVSGRRYLRSASQPDQAKSTTPTTDTVLKCERCPFTCVEKPEGEFPTASPIDQHMNLHTRFDTNRDQLSSYPCYSCELSFSAATALISHLKSKVCTQGMEWDENQPGANDFVEKPCDRCGWVYSFPGPTPHHHQNLHKNFDKVGEERLEFRCETNELAWTDKGGLLRHVKSKTCNECANDENVLARLNDTVPRRCPRCNLSFANSRGNLRQHMTLHEAYDNNSSTPWRCDKCELCWTNRPGLEKHRIRCGAAKRPGLPLPTKQTKHSGRFNLVQYRHLKDAAGKEEGEY